jgi:prepilin-type N-terminal cleavage/methylation domain-containing protein
VSKTKSSPQRRREGGFTVLELMVATAIMSIAVVGLLSLMSGTLSRAARIQEYDRTAMLARTKMNELLLMSPLPLGQPMGGQWDATTGWNAEADPFEKPANAGPGSDQLVRISLQVWWKAGEQRKSVSFEGFRRVAMPVEPRR